jgi:peroxiredoxin
MANLYIGDKVILFTLPGVDDKEHSLSDYADVKVLAVFFRCNY